MTDSRPHFSTFREFWPYYVGQHRKPLCRAIHYVGAVAALTLVGWGIATRDWRPIVATPFVSYGLAWFSHLVVERNRPATWGWVRWSLMGEYKMFFLAITGRMSREVERLYGSANPAPDAPCREPASEVES